MSDRGISLGAVAVGLRGTGMRATTGKPFSVTSLRDALLAWRVPGPAICNGVRSGGRPAGSLVWDYCAVLT